MTNVTVKCGWCKEEFDTDNSRNQKAESYGVKHCPHCGHRKFQIRVSDDL